VVISSSVNLEHKGQHLSPLASMSGDTHSTGIKFERASDVEQYGTGPDSPAFLMNHELVAWHPWVILIVRLTNG
jgi:hypothetical protein